MKIISYYAEAVVKRARLLFSDFDEGAAPDTPPAGRVRLYSKSDNKLYYIDDTGTESELTAGGNIYVLKAGGTMTGTLTLSAGVVDAPAFKVSGHASKLLASLTQTALSATFDSVANNTEQEVINLRTTLPVIPGTHTLKITFKGYVTTGGGNNNIRTRIGTGTNAMANVEHDNSYIGGAKTIETFTALVVANIDLTLQNYVGITVLNDNSTQISMSSAGNRTSVIVEIYK